MTVVALDHPNRRTHLFNKRVYLHAVFDQCERRIGVAQAAERKLLASLGTFEQRSVYEMSTCCTSN
jgi:hypothetical protein